MRIAFTGASGTGKTTLASWLAEKYGLELNPVGSRSVAKDMGFDNPYDVDKAGKRAEFQRRLLTEKIRWEKEHESFVTDRTTLDNLSYTMLHDASTIDADVFDRAIQGVERYTHVIYCPSEAFLDVAGDPNRVADLTYHKIYDAVLYGLMEKYTEPRKLVLHTEGLVDRKLRISEFLGSFS